MNYTCYFKFIDNPNQPIRVPFEIVKWKKQSTLNNSYLNPSLLLNGEPLICYASVGFEILYISENTKTSWQLKKEIKVKTLFWILLTVSFTYFL